MTTRFYFQNYEAAAVSPSYGGGGAWGYTSEASRYAMYTKKLNDPNVVGTRIGPWTAGQLALDRQYVSQPMAAGISFTSATVKCVVQMREFATSDNVRPRLGVYIVSKDGTTVRQTLLSTGSYFSSAELLDSGTRNARLADGDTVTGSYSTAEGDRLVVEIGYTDSSGTTPEGQGLWGDTASDAAENETTTTASSAWVEFSNSITFLTETPATTPYSEWLFNETSGSTVVDQNGNARDISWTGTGGTSAIGSGYLQLDYGTGTNYWETPNGSCSGLDDFSICFWHDQRSDPGGTVPLIQIGDGASGYGAQFYVFNNSATDTNVLALETFPTSFSIATISVAPPLTTKTFWCVTYKRTGGAADNVLRLLWTTDGSTWNTITLTNAVLITRSASAELRSGDAGYNFGVMRWHRVDIYNSVITFKEIQDLYALGSEGGSLIPTLISGSTTVAVSGSGTLQKTIQISGSTTVAVSGSGTLQKTIQISGSTTVAVSGTASLFNTVIGSTGSTTIAVSGSGDLQHTLAVSGSTTIAVSGSGDLQTVLQISGSTTIAVSSTASLFNTVIGSTGTTTIAISGSGTLQFAYAISGNGTISISGSGTISWLADPRIKGYSQAGVRQHIKSSPKAGVSTYNKSASVSIGNKSRGGF